MQSSEHDQHEYVSPDLARLFTAFQFAALAAHVRGELPRARRSKLEELFSRIKWPDQLEERMEVFLEEGNEAGIDFNPHVGRRQALLLASLFLGHQGITAHLIDWAERYNLDESALDYLAARVEESELFSTNAHEFFSRFFDPPDRLLTLVRKWNFELSVGLSNLTPIDHLKPEDYEHPWDRSALERMQNVKGFEKALRKFSEWHLEKISHMTSQSSRIRVGPKQFPELYELWRICCDRAQIGQHRPDLFVEYGALNAFTTGVEKPEVVVSSALVSLLDRSELLFVLGHELGHIRSEHVLYYMFAEWLPEVVDAIGQMTMGLGKLIGQGMQLAVLDWQRKSELTCDRHGLLVGQDLEAAIRVLMKLSGAPPTKYDRLNTDAFIQQGAEYEGLQDAQSKVYQFFLTANQDHP